MRTVGTMGLVVYAVGGPLLLGRVVSRNRQSPTFTQFHSAFRPSVVYWELVLLLRRILFLVASVTIPPRSAFRAVGQSIVVGASGALHLWAAPFAAFEENMCEMVSLCLILLNIIVSLCWRAAEGAGRGDINSCSTLVFAMNAIFVIYCAGRILWAGRAGARLRTLFGKRSKRPSEGPVPTDGLSQPLL